MDNTKEIAEVHQVNNGSIPNGTFAMVPLSIVETVLTFQAYRLLLRHFSTLENEPLEDIQRLTALMTTFKPAAVQAAGLLAQQQQQPPPTQPPPAPQPQGAEVKEEEEWNDVGEEEGRTK